MFNLLSNSLTLVLSNEENAIVSITLSTFKKINFSKLTLFLKVGTATILKWHFRGELLEKWILPYKKSEVGWEKSFSLRSVYDGPHSLTDALSHIFHNSRPPSPLSPHEFPYTWYAVLATADQAFERHSPVLAMT
jgi:hypothetical protein